MTLRKSEKTRSCAFHPRLEDLEVRQMMAADAAVSFADLTISPALQGVAAYSSAPLQSFLASESTPLASNTPAEQTIGNLAGVTSPVYLYPTLSLASSDGQSATGSPTDPSTGPSGSTTSGQADGTSNGASTPPLVGTPGGVSSDVDYIYSGQFNQAREYVLRPTLLVLTPGASQESFERGGSGNSEDDGWTYQLANNLAHDLNEAGSQVHIIRVNWASLSDNSNQAEHVARYVRNFLADRATEWDVVLVGHSRGAIFNTEVAHELGTVGNLHSLQHVLLDPTAAIGYGDVYPNSVPGNVDRAVVYDDGYAFGVIGGGLVRDGIEVQGADYRRVNPPGSDVLESHMLVAVTFAEKWYRDEISWKLNSADRHTDNPFQREDVEGYEVVVTHAGKAEQAIDFEFEVKDGELHTGGHASITILNVPLAGAVGDLRIGKNGISAGGGVTFLGSGAGGGLLVNQERLSINFSGSLGGVVNFGAGLNITSEETQLDLDAGPLRISLFGEGAGIYFGGNKVQFTQSLSAAAGTVTFEKFKAGGEHLKQTFNKGVETLREEFLADGRKVITNLVGGVSRVTEWVSIPGSPQDLANTLRKLSADDLASAIKALPTEKLADAVRFLGDRATEALASLSTGAVANVLEQLDTSTLLTALKGMSISRVANVLEKVNLETLESALSRLNTSRVADVLERVNGATLGKALKQLDTDRVAKVLEQVNSSTLTDAFERMGKSLAANVLEKIDAATLKVALKKLSVDRVADLLEKVDGGTLKAAFRYLSTSRAADILERIDTATLKNALKRISTEQIADVLDKVNSRTFKRALDVIDGKRLNDVLKDAGKQVLRDAEKYLKKADPGKLGKAFEDIGGGLSSAGKKLSKAFGF